MTVHEAHVVLPSRLVDALDLRVTFDVLHEEFTALQCEYDALAKRRYEAADHERYRARLRAFVNALHDWHQTRGVYADALKTQQRG